MVQAGFYITAPVKKHGSCTLPCEKILSISHCICNIQPDLNGCYFRRMLIKTEQTAYKKLLGLSDNEFSQMKNDISDMIDKKHLCFDSRFTVLSDAQRIYRHYLKNIPELRIIGISTEESCIGILNREGFEPLCCQYRYENNMAIGTEILGWDNGSFHSWLCNGLEKDISDKFPLKISELGLIQNSFYEAIQFAEHIAGMGEPVEWIPFLLSDCTEL